MAGRITYRHPEIHSDGGWIAPLKLSESAVTEIEKLIGRPLTEDEIASICKHLADIRFMKTGYADATAQDVKRTLKSFSKLSEHNSITAYRKSDSTTQALIDEALGCNMELTDEDWYSPTGKNLKIAASIALNNLQGRPGGRPVLYYRKQLAVYTLSLWKDLGMKPCTPWRHMDSKNVASPIVLFMAELALAVDKIPIDLKDIVSLLKEANEKR